MTNDTRKDILVLTIKYAPSVLALTCSAKIFFLTMNDTARSIWELGVNWVNWILNFAMLFAFYCMGKYFGFCWKHASLCRVAFWGYVYYAVFLLFGIPIETLKPLSILYVVMVITLTLIYKEVK